MAAKQDLLRARHRLTKLLLRLGQRYPKGGKSWSSRHMAWLRALVLPQPIQQAVKIDYRHAVDVVDRRSEGGHAGITHAACTDIGAGGKTDRGKRERDHHRRVDARNNVEERRCRKSHRDRDNASSRRASADGHVSA
jgi:hypothetical protein